MRRQEWKGAEVTTGDGSHRPGCISCLLPAPGIRKKSKVKACGKEGLGCVTLGEGVQKMELDSKHHLATFLPLTEHLMLHF